MWEDEQNPNILRNFNPYKTRLKKFLEGFQKYRGGSRPCGKKSKEKHIFSLDGFPNTDSQLDKNMTTWGFEIANWGYYTHLGIFYC